MPDAPEDLVLLHGFSGTRHAWDGVIAQLEPERYRVLALDLPGHGGGAAATLAGEPITFDSCVAGVLAAAPERFVLCGYSMGGRIALHVALAAPARVSRLALVSSSPGIADEHDRADRRAADRALAAQLEVVPYERFIERWRSQPLFAGDPPASRELAARDMRRNDPRALAAAMRGLGTGEMEPLWERLGELAMPVELIAGRRDLKFRALAARMAAQLREVTLTVLDGGHGLTYENAGGIARALCLPVVGDRKSETSKVPGDRPITREIR